MSPISHQNKSEVIKVSVFCELKAFIVFFEHWLFDNGTTTFCIYQEFSVLIPSSIFTVNFFLLLSVWLVQLILLFLRNMTRFRTIETLTVFESTLTWFLIIAAPETLLCTSPLKVLTVFRLFHWFLASILCTTVSERKKSVCLFQLFPQHKLPGPLSLDLLQIATLSVLFLIAVHNFPWGLQGKIHTE